MLGYLLKKLKYPIAPLVLALVLGNQAENAFRQSMILSQGSLGVFWSNGLVGTIATVAVLLLFWPLIGWVYGKARNRDDAATAEQA